MKRNVGMRLLGTSDCIGENYSDHVNGRGTVCLVMA